MDFCTATDPETGREVASMWKDEFLELIESHNRLLAALEIICSDHPRHRDGMDGPLPVGIKAARIAIEKART